MTLNFKRVLLCNVAQTGMIRATIDADGGFEPFTKKRAQALAHVAQKFPWVLVDLRAPTPGEARLIQEKTQ